ncbi:MAG: D-cysteine desulfhydrase family protein [bacterium]|nr:D-cysteine desulfhydrase family protein [bacterium]
MVTLNNSDDVSRLEFAHLPTKIEPMKALQKALGGPNLFVKRDDCTGLAGGGNKTRKLEFIMAEAKEQKADAIITQGSVQSNHVRQTAAISAKLGLPCHVVVSNPIGSEDEQYLKNGNMLLNHFLGAIFHKVPHGTEVENVSRIEGELKGEGKNPYVIPLGGSNALGALGYVECAREILSQAGNMNIHFDWIVHASASGGTQAGLVAGFVENHSKPRVLGISAMMSESELSETVFELVKEICQPSNLSPDKALINVNGDFIGEGYGVSTAEGLKAIKLAARTEGIILDPVYTGKAMAGLISLIKDKEGNPIRDSDNVLFLHTGGSQGLYGYINLL